jgi:hypothetical protein
VAVKSVTVSPGNLSVWSDWGGRPIKFAVRVTPGDASDKAVIWSSSDESVAEVNPQTGEISLIGEGAAEITAEAADGSGKSGSAELAVTPAKNRSEANRNLLNISGAAAVSADRVDKGAALGWPSDVGTGVVSMWAGNKTAALTITVDDAINAEYAAWLAWAEAYDVPLTFFAPGNRLTDDNMTSEQPIFNSSSKSELQSHTWNHYAGEPILTTAENMYDYQRPVEYFNEHGKPPVKTVAYAEGKPHDTARPYTASEYYIAARGVSGQQNDGARVNYDNVGSISVPGALGSDTSVSARAANLAGKLNNTITPGNAFYGGWTSFHNHYLNTGSYAGTGQIWENVLQTYLNPDSPSSLRDEIWADTFTNVAMYGQERDTATLSVTDNTTDIAYTLTDKMDDAVFNFPLTVKIKIPDSWGIIRASQGGKLLPLRTVTNENGKYALIETVPDKGEVTLSPTADGVTVANSAVTDSGGDTIFEADISINAGAALSAYLVKYNTSGASGILTAADAEFMLTGGRLSLSVPKASQNEEIYLFLWDGNMKPLYYRVSIDTYD